eukprot:scaffold269903_cov28-Tisochrysis_lutea.AAC.2
MGIEYPDLLTKRATLFLKRCPAAHPNGNEEDECARDGRVIVVDNIRNDAHNEKHNRQGVHNLACDTDRIP